MEDLRAMMEESMARDAERKARMIADVQAQFPQYDITSCKNNGATYGTFKVYLNRETEIHYEGYGLAFPIKTSYGYTMDWLRKDNTKVAIVELGYRVYVFEATSWLERIYVSVFSKTTGERIKGERRHRAGHLTHKGVYVELNGKRVYLDFQDAPAEPALPLIEEPTAVEEIKEQPAVVTEMLKDDAFRTKMAVAAAKEKDIKTLIKCSIGAPFDLLSLYAAVTDEELNADADLILTEISDYIPAEAVAAWNSRTFTFMVDLDREEIINEAAYKVLEHYESDDMTMKYDIVQMDVPAGQLLKVRSDDGVIRYASDTQDGQVTTWTPLELLDVYIERPTYNGIKVNLVSDCGSWYRRRGDLDVWQPITEYADNERLVKLEGPQRETVLASWQAYIDALEMRDEQC